jgi:hypothetical protein
MVDLAAAQLTQRRSAFGKASARQEASKTGSRLSPLLSAISYWLSEEQLPLEVLLAIVNVHLRFAHAGVGYGLRQRFAVGRKLPVMGFGCLTF